MAEITDVIPAKIQLKKEKTSLTPLKSSTEILSELFGQFNAKPPEISESLRSDSDKYQKKLKKKKKHKEKKKKKSEKRKRSSSGDSLSSDVESPKKKSKKSKHKKHKKRSKSNDSENGYVKKKEKRSYSPDSPLPTKSLHDLSSSKNDAKDRKVILDMGTFSIRVNNNISTKERKKSLDEQPDIKPDITCLDKMDSIPRPKTPDISQIKLPDELSSKTISKTTSDNAEKSKTGSNKIQIKNLKFSSVFEANVKMAEEEARKKAEKYEDGELSDSSSYSSIKIPTDNDSEIEINKSSDLREKLNNLTRRNFEIDKTSIKVSKSDKKNSDRDKANATEEKSKESRSRSKKRSKSKSPKRSRSKSGSVSRSRRRSRSRSRHRHRRSSRHHHNDDKRTSRTERRRSKDRDSRFEIDKKRLLEIARKNAISMLQNGALPAAVVLGPLAQQKVISAIKSGGKSVDELTDFCKNLSRQEALGELSSVSEDSDNSEINESEARPFHHPFLVKDKAPIVLNIKGGTALPTHTFQEKTMEQSKVLRLQFPVSSGSQHRGAEGEWRPVSPSALPPLPKHVPNPPLIKSNKLSPGSNSTVGPLAICAPPDHTVTALSPVPPAIQYSASNIPIPTVPGMAQPAVIPAIPPGPQVFPSEANAATIDIGSIVSQRLTAIRKLQQNPNDVSAISQMYQVNKEMSKWAQSKQEPGQFTGSTGAQILTPRELASGYQAWVKRDQLQTAAPVSGGMGMHLLQKMGWKPGEGLGKEKNGSLTPLLLEIKLDTKGLVAKEETKQRNNPRRGGTATIKTLAGKHPVSLLGEFCSKRKLGVPSYSLCFECGPDHKKNFLFKVTVNGVEYQPNVASANKKQAKADAAQLCLQKLGLLPN